MATIKSYTDIKQSKKLAEILPFKSADMLYLHWINRTKQEGIDTIPTIKESLPIESYDIPCWSVAALLDVLPNGIIMNKDSQNGRYHFSSTYIKTYVTADNPVDACYEMIIKLKELNLL